VQITEINQKKARPVPSWTLDRVTQSRLNRIKSTLTLLYPYSLGRIYELNSIKVRQRADLTTVLSHRSVGFRY